MQPTFSFFQLLFLFSALQGFILSGLILRKGTKRPASLLLASFILLFALASLKVVLQETIAGFGYSPVPLLYQFAFGPLLYGYVRSSLDPGFAFSRKHYWHLLPVVLFDVLLFLVFCLIGPGRYTHQVPKLRFCTDVLACLSFMAYWGAAWRCIHVYKVQLKRNEPASRPAVGSWFNQVLLGAGLIGVAWLVYIVLVLTGYHKYWQDNMLPYYPVFVVVGIGTYWIGIKGYFQPHLDLIHLPAPEKKELLPPAVLAGRKAQLLAALQEHRYHFDEDITVQSLAGYLGLPAKDLSYVINTGFGQNFSDFINSLRIEDLKQRLLDPGQRKYSIMGLAAEVGFNSKPSLYRAFKKSTGQTPSEFLKQHGPLAG